MEPMEVVARILYVIWFNGIGKCACVAIANMSIHVKLNYNVSGFDGNEYANGRKRTDAQFVYFFISLFHIFVFLYSRAQSRNEP